jgi:hypothetical protein
MRKGRIRKFSMGVALAAAVGLWVPAAHADLDGAVVYVEPAGALIMPFDQTENNQSYQIVTRLGNTTSGPIATHWSYWSADCRHLFDVFVCLTQNDTKVMDPSKVQGEIQSPNPPMNNPIGASRDLTGERGMVTVTAYFADTGPSGLECNVPDVQNLADNEIVGAWVIANTATNAAYGTDAIGISNADGGVLPEAEIIDVSGEGGPGIFIQTFNPLDLGDSEVILLGVESAAGNGRFRDVEVGPIRRAIAPGANVCCDASYTDNLEITVSLPDVCFLCTGFNPISDIQAEAGETSIIPPNVTLDRPGFVHLRNCTTLNEEGLPDLISDAGFSQFIFGYHGQAVGQFGTVVSAKYSGTPF